VGLVQRHAHGTLIYLLLTIMQMQHVVLGWTIATFTLGGLLLKAMARMNQNQNSWTPRMMAGAFHHCQLLSAFDAGCVHDLRTHVWIGRPSLMPWQVGAANYAEQEVLKTSHGDPI
jgi:hypothetical protein